MDSNEDGKKGASETVDDKNSQNKDIDDTKDAREKLGAILKSAKEVREENFYLSYAGYHLISFIMCFLHRTI